VIFVRVMGNRKRWRKGLWVSLALVLLSILSLAPYMTSSTELVRMRNALLLDERHNATDDWRPPAFPPDFKREVALPYPEFSRVVQKLGLSSMDNDWDRALAISKHLLGSSPVLSGGAIQSNLTQTYRRIVEKGEGYCGDFVDVFIALANAAGMTTRPWAFSFDGFGGYGHIWLEIWNRQAQGWQLVGIFNNNYFSLEDGRPLSALEFRRIFQERPMALQTHRLYAEARPGYSIESKGWDYYRRGLPEWYQWRGNNVFEYDQAPLVRMLRGVSRSLEQLGGIVAGVSPKVVVLLDDKNRPEFDALLRLRMQLYLVMLTVFLGSIWALVCWVNLYRQHRNSTDD
jgi:hypothetical protein